MNDEKKIYILYWPLSWSVDCLLARTRDHDLRCRSHIYLFVVCCFFFASSVPFVLSGYTHRSTAQLRERNQCKLSVCVDTNGFTCEHVSVCMSRISERTAGFIWLSSTLILVLQNINE